MTKLLLTIICGAILLAPMMAQKTNTPSINSQAQVEYVNQ